MNLLTLKERVRAQDRPLAPLPHHNGSRTSTFLPPPLSPTNRQRGATLLFTEVPRSGILRRSAVVSSSRKPASAVVVLRGGSSARRLTSSTIVAGDATLWSTA